MSFKIDKLKVVVPAHSEAGVKLARCVANVSVHVGDTMINVYYNRYTRLGARLLVNAIKRIYGMPNAYVSFTGV